MKVIYFQLTDFFLLNHRLFYKKPLYKVIFYAYSDKITINYLKALVMLLKIISIIVFCITISPVIKANNRVKDDLIPRKALFALSDKFMMKFSPKGKYISYIPERNGDKMRILVVNSEDMNNTVASIEANPNSVIYKYFWANDDNHIFYYTLLKNNAAISAETYVYNLKTKQAKLLNSSNNTNVSVIATSAKRPEEVLLRVRGGNQKDFNVYLFNLIDYSKKLIFTSDKFSELYFDEDLQLCFGSYINKKNEKEYWQFIDNNWKFFINITLEDKNTELFNCNSKNNIMYLLDSRNRDNIVLKSLNLKSGKLKLIAEDKNTDIRIFTSDPSSGKVQAVSTNYDKPKYRILDSSIKDDFKYLESLNLGKINIIKRSLDDQIWFVEFYSDIKPTKYYKYDRKNKQIKYLFTHHKELENYSLAPMNPVIIKSRDGLNLVSYLTLPNNIGLSNKIYPKKPLPLVLLVHGGPDERDEWGMDLLHQWLANRDYAVLSVNFRGSEGFGRKFLNSGDGEWGRKMQNDLIDAVHWAINNKIADPKKIAIMGTSYGGYAALAGLTFTPELFACGIDISGPSHLGTILNYFSHNSSTDKIYKLKIGSSETIEDRAKLYQYSPLTYVTNIKKPLLIKHGYRDTNVPQTESDQIVEAMNKHNIPVIYTLYKNEIHFFLNESNKFSFYAIAERFLAKHLGGRFEPFDDEVLNNPNLVLNGSIPSEELLEDLLNK